MRTSHGPCLYRVPPPWCVHVPCLPNFAGAAEYYDDEPLADLDPTVDILEREAAKLLQQVGQAVGRLAGRAKPSPPMKLDSMAFSCQRTRWRHVQAVPHLLLRCAD